MDTLEWIGWLSTIIAITGVIANNKRKRACFALWWASNLLTLGIHVYSGLAALAVRDALFFALAIHGWFCWSKDRH